MAAYRTSTATWTTTSGSKGAAVAALPGDFLVAFVSHQVNTSSHAVTDASGGTWVQAVAPTADAVGTGRQSVWVRTNRVDTAATITVTTAPGTTSGGGLVVYAISGMMRTGLAAIRSSGTQSTLAAGTPAPVLSLTPLTTSVILAFVQTQTNGSANCVPRSSPAYTERHDQGYNTPTSGLETSSINSGETSATITHGGATPSGFSSMAIELDATDPSSVRRHPLFPHGPRRMPVMGPKVLLRQSFPDHTAASVANSVTHSAGSFLLTGGTAHVTVTRAETAGNFLLTGGSHSRTVTKVHTAANFLLTGGTHTAAHGFPVSHSAGNFLLTGGTAHVTVTRQHTAGNFLLSGGADHVSVTKTHSAGNLLFTGGTSSASAGRSIAATAGNFILTGGNGQVTITRNGTAGSLVFTGGDHVLQLARVISHEAANFLLSGGDHGTTYVPAGGTPYTVAHASGELVFLGGTHVAVKTTVEGQSGSDFVYRKILDATVDHTAGAFGMAGGNHVPVKDSTARHRMEEELIDLVP